MPAELTLGEIQDLMGEGKSRMYKPSLIEFHNSGKIYEDFMENPAFAQKNPQSVLQSLRNNLDKLVRENAFTDTIQITRKELNGKDMVLVVNMTKLAGANESK